MRHVRSVKTGPGKATALFGGTFDPVHYGHLRSAIEIRDLLNAENYRVDDFRFLPAGTPAHRSNVVSEATHRLAMLKMALAGVQGMTIDERELNRSGPSYMVDSLEELRESDRKHPIILILGQDSANSLDTWHRWTELFRLAHLVIMTRPGDRESYSDPLAEEFSHRLKHTPGELFTEPSYCRPESVTYPFHPAGFVKYCTMGEIPIFCCLKRYWHISGNMACTLPRRFLYASDADRIELTGTTQR
jgi:nicotinate-nucleotide adenylyltransferase